MKVCSLSIALAACWIAAAADAQTASPPRRAHHSIIYDESRQRILLTGGSTPVNGGTSFEFFNDLWEFDGKAWTQLVPSGEKLSGISAAYDSRRKRVVSFGGYRGESIADLRVLEQDAWTKIGEHAEMPAAEPGFVYDIPRDRLVAFGGSAGRGQAHGDTWTYDGNVWTKIEGAGPGARQAHMMAFDAKRGRTVLFGGMGTAPRGERPPTFGDTWEFDGSSWRKLDVSGPSPRTSAGITYDSRRGLVILFGGLDSAGFKGDTWSWNGSEWKLLSTAGPEPRAMGYIAYDKARDRVVLFGGRKGYPDGDLDDTWEWDGTAWRAAVITKR